jgi:transposase
MMAEKRKTYTPEFKREAVRLVTEHHYGIAETARNLGINTNMLRRWKRELADNENNAFPGKGRFSPEQEELHRLRAENKRLRMERDILKNCVVAFARHVWVEKCQPVGYRHSSGRSDRRPLGGTAPVKKPGPGNGADVRVVTP